jgi:hypothetical protein
MSVRFRTQIWARKGPKSGFQRHRGWFPLHEAASDRAAAIQQLHKMRLVTYPMAVGKSCFRHRDDVGDARGRGLLLAGDLVDARGMRDSARSPEANIRSGWRRANACRRADGTCP